MISVLVTGGNGQLASCTKVVAKEVNDINFIFTDVQELDITNSVQVNSFFQKHKIDYCVNCAAYTAVDKAESELELAYAINSRGAENLALACLKYKSKLIQISTDFVFDGSKVSSYLETNKPNQA